MTTRVGIFVFNDVEVLDFAGPYEVFTTAARVQRRIHNSAIDIFNVATIGSTTTTVRARAGLRLYPDYDFSNHTDIDLLIIPGGVVDAELRNAMVIRWIESAAKRAQITASVCTGAFLLAQAGLLTNKSATTHWQDIDDLRALFPAVSVRSDVRWVDQGSVVTSAGISAGIDMSLHLVERCAGRELAEQTARQMEFDWRENS